VHQRHDVADEGPLTEIMAASIANLVDDLHTWLWDALLAVIALHVIAIVIYAVAKGHNLLRPMLTGRKPLPWHRAPPRLASPTLALLMLCWSAAAAALVATFL
jgi:hypothetical protein